MIKKGILIRWASATEYIAIDLESINPHSQVNSTIEYWRSTKQFVCYNTTSNVLVEGDSYTLEIHYESSCNPSIPPRDVCWGTSVIRFSPGATSGVVTWVDNNYSENNGEKTWINIDNGMYKIPVKKLVARLHRNQEKLRKALLAIDASCAITGEKTIAVLEAAHIISSANLGAEVIENSILLRSDIHKLFDANLFTISNSGEIVIMPDKRAELSENYQKLLQEKGCVDRSVFERVASALNMVLNL